MMGSVSRGARNGRDNDTHVRHKDGHVNDVESELALDAPPRGSTRDVDKADGKCIVKLCVRGDSIPDAERAVETDEVEEDPAVEGSGLEPVGEGALKAREPTLPVGRRSGVLARTDGKSHLWVTRM